MNATLATAGQAVVSGASLPSLTGEELSSIFGYLSIGCWVIVYRMFAPVWENYMLKSGEGLSLGFILLWMAGDITNLIGGAMAGLLPTMIILATYMYYYRALARQREKALSERQPLLEIEAPKQLAPLLPASVMYPLLIIFVSMFGLLAWVFDAGETRNPKIPEKGPGGVELEWRSQLLGYISAVLYFASRVPQISHNYKTRCEGLSLAMFFFSISGNVTYIASILFKSLEWKYLVTNASWIAGSVVTIFLDFIILGQFGYFSWQDKQRARAFIDDGDYDAESV